MKVKAIRPSRINGMIVGATYVIPAKAGIQVLFIFLNRDFRVHAAALDTRLRGYDGEDIARLSERRQK